jgi:hypothetical protein
MLPEELRGNELYKYLNTPGQGRGALGSDQGQLLDGLELLTRRSVCVPTSSSLEWEWVPADFGFGQWESPSEGASICWNLGVSQAKQVEICPSSDSSSADGRRDPENHRLGTKLYRPLGLTA